MCIRDRVSTQSTGVALAALMAATDTRVQQLTDLFTKVDVDGGGTLDQDELKEAFGEELGSKLLSDLDEDGDGELSMEEFVDGMQAKFPGDALNAKIEELQKALA
eukprot:TRINITY_DN17031_c0_g1_i1.p2 TRINITY_DN17031_c0_g1~~TRINITY_DN17031_c0_g1_i1.p2  ORF type:complete len:105 (-),score=44.76 TRINITY_DN17031_c0_g1_i1:453-767(-)